MRIAMLQMTSGIDPVANAASLTAAIDEASRQGALMLFAPEMSGLLDRDRARAAAHIFVESQSSYVAAARQAAADAGIWVHLGSLPVRDDTSPATSGQATPAKWRNRSLVIDSDGVIRARYDKIHLFDIDLPTGESWRESSAYAPGATAVAVDTPLGRLGLTICYDLRFAALFDALSAAGSTVIAVPSAFTVPTGAAHWHVLLRARAIEQGCFIIAAAQSGCHADGRTTYGHSLVVDPWGEIVCDAGTEPGLSLVDLDLSRIAEVRARLPVIAHRRPFSLPASEKVR